MIALVVSMGGVMAAATPAAAQSLLQSIFGFLGGGEPSRPAGPRVLSPPIVTSPQRGGPLTYSPYAIQPLPPPRGAYGEPAPQRETRYRSVCVRTCDGFYFPVSHGVGRSALYKDQKTCAARCGESAELFFHPVDGGTIETAQNFAGRSYKSLPNAFRYRKTLVNGCACKPAPWSTAETQRHARYAREAGMQSGAASGGGETGDSHNGGLQPRDAGSAVVVSGDRPGTHTSPPVLPIRAPMRPLPRVQN